MTWRDDYIAAALDGVGFFVSDDQKTGGRRVTAHEFADIDGAQIEDSGGKPHRHQITAVVIGENYQVDLQLLEEVLDAPGPHVLDHPKRGVIENLHLEGDYTTSQTRQQGGLATVTFTLVQRALPEPLIFEATVGAIIDAAQQVALAALDEFNATADLSDYLGYMTNGLNFVTDKVSAALNYVTTQVGQVGDAADQLAQLKSSVQTFKANPRGWVSSLWNTVGTLMSLIPDRPSSPERTATWFVASSLAGIMSEPSAGIAEQITQLQELPPIPQVPESIAGQQVAEIVGTAAGLTTLAEKLTTVLVPNSDAAEALYAQVQALSDQLLLTQYADFDDGDGVPVGSDLEDAVAELVAVTLKFLDELTVPVLGTTVFDIHIASAVELAWLVFGPVTDFEAKLEQLLELNPGLNPLDIPPQTQIVVVVS